MPGTKKYSPPRTVTTRAAGRGRTAGSPGTVILCGGAACAADEDVLVVAESRRRCRRLNHCAWTNSNWRAMLACRHMKITPRSWPSSSAPRRQRIAVGDAAPDEAVAVDELALEREAVARVGAADVRADRAAQAVVVVA